MIGTIVRSSWVALVVLAFNIGCEESPHNRRPTKVYIPEGYVGWVRTEYNVPGAPSETKDIFGPWIYEKIPPSGLLQISTPIRNNGAASVSYYYSSSDSNRQLPYEMIHGGAISLAVVDSSGHLVKEQFDTFFVGTNEQYEAHKNELKLRRFNAYQLTPEQPNYLPPVGDLRGK